MQSSCSPPNSRLLTSFEQLWRTAVPAHVLQHKSALPCRLLNADSRNFHGWSYWQWLVGQMQLDADQKEQYTRLKVCVASLGLSPQEPAHS